MALPQINEINTYPIVVPSTGKKVLFRPYLVKEEKILLMAYESKDQNQILGALKKTIEACSEETLDVDRMALFDIQYIFVQLRAKSVGETANVFIKCSGCEENNEVSINLENVQVGEQSDPEVRISDNYTVVMAYPSYELAAKLLQNELTNTEELFEITRSCIKGVKGPDEYYDFSEESVEDTAVWMENLKSSQLELLFKFVQSEPEIQAKVHFTCDQCNVENDRVLEGLENFF